MILVATSCMNILSLFPPTPPHAPPHHIHQIKDIINNGFINAEPTDGEPHETVALEWSYNKGFHDLPEIIAGQGVLQVNTINVHLKNTSADRIYKISGNTQVMNLMGVVYGWVTGSAAAVITPNLKSFLIKGLATTATLPPNDPSGIQFIPAPQGSPLYHNGGTTILTLHPGQEHIDEPFGKQNDNIYNFSVKEGSTERWIFHNRDNLFMDSHPLHFHLTQGFLDLANTDPINHHPINGGSKDVYYMKAGTKIAFLVKFPNFNSTQGTIPNLGYMFHCHLMIHHDMNMMGQYYVDPA